MAGVGRAMRIAKLEKKKFSDALEEYVDAYNSWPHSVTGIPPRDLLYGWVVRSELPASNRLFDKYPMSLVARDRDEKFKEEKKRKTDIKRCAKESTLAVGDWVHLKLDSQPNKLAPTFTAESFKIIKKEGGRVTLLVNDRERVRRTMDVKRKRSGEHLGTGVPVSEEGPQQSSMIEQNLQTAPVLRRSTRTRRTPRDRAVMVIRGTTNQDLKGKRCPRMKKASTESNCKSCGKSNGDIAHSTNNDQSTCGAPTREKRCFGCGLTGHFVYKCNTVKH